MVKILLVEKEVKTILTGVYFALYIIINLPIRIFKSFKINRQNICNQLLKPNSFAEYNIKHKRT